MSKTAGAAVISCLRYRDAPRAIEWLCATFGFHRQLVVPGEGNVIAHAQLTLGQGMLMLGSIQDNEYGRLVTDPSQTGGKGTQSVYLVVDDADAVYARVQAAGAKVEMPIKDEDYGGRGFSCRDPEGHLWSVGTYDPWAG